MYFSFHILITLINFASLFNITKLLGGDTPSSFLVNQLWTEVDEFTVLDLTKLHQNYRVLSNYSEISAILYFILQKILMRINSEKISSVFFGNSLLLKSISVFWLVR